MQMYRKVFPKKHTFLAVIHAESLGQVERNMRIAIMAGADGAFLINHSISADRLIPIYASMRGTYPNFWLGMNMLDLKPVDALGRMPDNEGGLWVDDAGIVDEGVLPEAITFKRYRRDTSSWKGIYFGGVAFKHQAPIINLVEVAKGATSYVDVVTTSGSATGSAPSVAKIRAMKMAIGDHPLAVASGMTPENVHEYKPFADCFIVATGISDSFYEINPARAAKFREVLDAT